MLKGEVKRYIFNIKNPLPFAFNPIYNETGSPNLTKETNYNE